MSTQRESNILLGTSLFSFTVEWLSRRYTLDQMLEKVVELGGGPGLELVGFQSIRDFPAISDAFAAHFREQVARLGLQPTALGANIDGGRYTGRVLTMDETVASVERQLEAARKLGFPLLRIQLVGQEVLEKILPLAERAGIQIACEVHAPLTPAHPSVMVVREMCDRTQSPYLGLVLDFSASMIQPPAGYWHRLRQLGAAEDLIAAATEIWHGDASPPAKFAALAQAGQANGADTGVMGQLNMVMTMFAHMPVPAWHEALPYSRHLHGKFYHVDETGNEPSIPYPQIIALLKESGYRGSISAECEGSAFMDVQDAVPGAEFGEVQRWHAMVRRLLVA